VFNDPVNRIDPTGLFDMNCYAKCLEKRRWDLWKWVFPVAAYPKRILPPFRVPRKDQKWTTIPSVVNHYAGGRSLRDFMRKIPGIQRAATAVLFIDGAHDWYLMFDCVFNCKENECK